MEEKYTIVNISPAESNAWLEYIKSKSEATIFYHPLWLMALNFETGQDAFILICLDEQNNIVGGLPLQYTKGMYFGLGGVITQKRVSSLPRTPLMDIIADNNLIRSLLIKKALEIAGSVDKSIFQLKSLNLQFYSSIEKLKIIRWREEYFLNLPEIDKNIRFGDGNNHRKIKWAVNKAKKAGVVIKKECSFNELKLWYKLYLDTCRWHATFPRPFKFFQFLYDKFYPAGLMHMYLAFYKDTQSDKEQLIAGSLILNFNETVFYAFNGRNAKYFNLRPNDLIQWEAIHDAHRAGFKRYHFGEVSHGQEGLAEFKKKWCNQTAQIYHLYSDNVKENKINNEASYSGDLKLKIWRKIPLNITEKIGNIVYSRL